MYIRIYFPKTASFYMMDPILAMKSELELIEKLSIINYVIWKLEEINLVYKERATPFMKKNLISGDRGGSKPAILALLESSDSDSDEPNYSYLYDDRSVVEQYIPERVLDIKTTILPLDVSSDLTFQLNCFIYALNFILRYEFFTNTEQIVSFMSS
jgi:hypothetical protein